MPVSFLHEAACVSIYCAAVYRIPGGDVRLMKPTSDVSGNILDGIASVFKERYVPSIGLHPDISLWDANGNLLRVVEVEAKSPLTASSAEKYAASGVELLRVSVKTLADLNNLVWMQSCFIQPMDGIDEAVRYLKC